MERGVSAAREASLAAAGDADPGNLNSGDPDVRDPGGRPDRPTADVLPAPAPDAPIAGGSAGPAPATTAVARGGGAAPAPPAAVGDASALCMACGACCAYSRDWPRFTLEDDAAIALIPEALVDPSGAGMAWDAGRCSALDGEVGRCVACRIYEVRPLVCRDCEPGDPECLIARRRHGLGGFGAPQDEVTVA